MLCTSEVRNLAYTLLNGGFAWKDVANAATLASHSWPSVLPLIVLRAVRT